MNLLSAVSWNVDGGNGGAAGAHGKPGPGGPGGRGGAGYEWYVYKYPLSTTKAQSYELHGILGPSRSLEPA